MADEPKVVASSGDGDTTNAPTVMLKLCIQSLTGQTTIIEVAEKEEVYAVKAQLAEVWGVPVRCQKHILGSTILEGKEAVGECCAGLPSEAPIVLTFLYVPPYDGDVQKACLKHDTEAIRILMKNRDREKSQTVSAGLAVLIHGYLSKRRGWPRIREALVDLGYAGDDVDRAFAQLPETPLPCYAEVLEQLRMDVGAPKQQPEYVRWWRTPPS